MKITSFHAGRNPSSRLLHVWLVSLFAVFALQFLLFVPRANADGGAPNLAYVAGGSQGVSIIDIAQQKVTGTITVDGDPHTVYLSLDGRFLYVTQPELDRVALVSAQSKQTLCTANVPGQPTLLAFDPGTNILYAAGNGADTISALDSTTCALKYTITMTGPVYGLAVALLGASGPYGGSGNQLWATDSRSLSVLDSSGKLLSRVPIAGGPRYISIPTGITAYITTASGTVVAVDLATRQVSRPLITGGKFMPMDYDAYTDEVYVPDQLHNQIDVLSPVTSASAPPPHEPSRIIRLDVAPESIAITSDGQLGFVALSGGNVAMLDIPGHQLINTIHVGGTPHFIITGLYPPLIGSTPQQANVYGTIINVVAYLFLILLVLVPILLLRRAKPKPTKPLE
jgi:DNA-binding beta-propeller fold protein YncE